MYGMMKNYISEATLADCMCSSIYVDELYMIQAIIEAIILLIMIFFVKIIHKYINGKRASRQTPPPHVFLSSLQFFLHPQ